VRFEIDNIRWDDSLGQARAETFLAENPDPGVRQRPDEIFRRAMTSGQALSITENGKFCGLSLVFQYDPGNSLPVYHEIGTMRVTKSGYRLQAFLAQFHLLQISIENDFDCGEVFAVVSPDTASQHNLLHHCGMTPWQPTDLLSMLRRQVGTPFAAEKEVLLAEKLSIQRSFNSLRSLHIRDNVFNTPNGGAEIGVAMRWFHPDVLEEEP
jgi:hypothetical protein